MQAEERDPAYLWDMIEAARTVAEFVQDLTLEEFLAPGREREMRRLAIERKLEILGEAARRVSLEFRNHHAEIPWKEIVGLRNVISHEYNKVSYEEIYRIVQTRIPELIALLEPLVPPIPEIED